MCITKYQNSEVNKSANKLQKDLFWSSDRFWTLVSVKSLMNMCIWVYHEIVIADRECR